MTIQPRIHFLAALCSLAALGLTACGGGEPETASDPTSASRVTASGGATAAQPAPAAAPSAAGTATPVASAPGSAAAPTVDISCGLPAFQASVLEELNRRRAAGAVCGADAYPAAAALAWNPRLAQAAFAHSQDMATNNYFSHTGLSGGTMSQRVDTQGYVWSALGENIAAGYSSVASVVQGWMDSPGHCRNIMNAQFTEIGMACSSVTGSRYGLYFTLDLGRPR